MKLSFMSWKRAFSLCLAVVLAFSIVLGQMSHSSAIRLLAGAKNNGTEKASVQYDDKIHYSEIEDITCTPSNITIAVSIWMWDKDMEVTGAEIYRAKIEANRKRGNFKKIGVCRELKQNQYDKYRWDFTYSDSTVKAGQAYVYKCRGFRQVGNVKKFQKEDIRTRKGVAANTVGEYTCDVVKSTSRKLVVNITGKNKNNGLLECNFGDELSRSAWLVCKNEGQEEICKRLTPEAYSYNGKKWYSEPNLKIKKKESVYLRFRGENIAVSGYQYAQAIVENMRYNLCPQNDSDMTEMRLNLAFGNALADDFMIPPTRLHEGKTKWDGDIFQTNIFTAKSEMYDDKLALTNMAVDCTPKRITVKGHIATDGNVKPAGVEIYRAKIKANGKRGNFKKIGVCNKIKEDADHKNEWNFTYKDNAVKTGKAYAYKCRSYRKTGNVEKYYSGNTQKGVTAKSAGKYKCKVVKNTGKKLIVKITGKNKNNGPLERIESGGFKGVYLVFKNKGKEGGAYGDVKLEAFSYNGKKWHKGRLFHIKGKDSVYLRFSRSGHDIDMSKYKYVQMMLEYMQYNLSPKKDRPNEMPQLRLNLTSGEALTGQFIKWVDNKWVTEWDKGIFDDSVYEGE